MSAEECARSEGDTSAGSQPGGTTAARLPRPVSCRVMFDARGQDDTCTAGVGSTLPCVSERRTPVS